MGFFSLLKRLFGGKYKVSAGSDVLVSEPEEMIKRRRFYRPKRLSVIDEKKFTQKRKYRRSK